jgi:hypothetical protein
LWVQAIILFLNAQNVHLIEIYHHLIAVYGEGVMNWSDIRKWCQMSNKGWTNVHDKEQCWCLSLIDEYLKNRTEQHVRTNRHYTFDKIHEKFLQISCSLIHEIVTEDLHYKKICARWMPWMLTEKHQSKHMDAALMSSVHYH